MAKELVDVKVVIERHGTDEVLSQGSVSVTSKMLDPDHRDSAAEVVNLVEKRVRDVFGRAYMEACPKPIKSESDTPTEV